MPGARSLELLFISQDQRLQHLPVLTCPQGKQGLTNPDRLLQVVLAPGNGQNILCGGKMLQQLQGFQLDVLGNP